MEVRHGGLGLRQLGIAATHCRLEPLVANFMKVLCSQEIYKYELFCRIIPYALINCFVSFYFQV